jgi:hypothetical protein
MRYLKWVGVALLVAVVPVLAFVAIVKAERIATFIDKGEIVNHTVYGAGKSVELNGTINGDVYCAGQSVNINATVHGDVICAGSDVTIGGKVDGSVRVAGQNVSVSAEVARSMTITASTFSLDAGAKVGQDATLLGSTLNVKGSVGRDIVAAGTSLAVNASVGRNIKFDGKELVLRGDAKIGGDVNYASGQKAALSPGANVKGHVNQTVPVQKKKNWFGFSVMLWLFCSVALTLVVLVVALAFPQALNSLGGLLLKQWPMALLVGFVAGVAAPVAIGLLLISFIGIPLALILLLLWLVLAIASGPAAAYFVGRLIFGRRARNAIVVAIAGGFALVTGYFIPFVGPFVFFGAYWLGSGAILIALKNHLPKPNYKIQT